MASAIRGQLPASSAHFGVHVAQVQGAAITLSRPSMGSAPAEDQGFAYGGGVSDDFKRFLEQHPGLSFDEAPRRFKDEKKAKQRRKGLKLG